MQSKEFRPGVSSFAVATSTTKSHMGVGHAGIPGYWQQYGRRRGCQNIAPRLPVQDTTKNVCPNLLRGHVGYQP